MPSVATPLPSGQGVAAELRRRRRSAATRSGRNDGAAIACALGRMTVVTANFSVTTTRRTELIDITCDVNAAIRAAGVRTGIVSANTAHTTAALLINEFEPALMDDLVSL